jgi:hypothetical protein
MEKHIRNISKDGRKTNPAISRILECKPERNGRQFDLYLAYCRRINNENRKNATNGKKFWCNNARELGIKF